MKISFILSLIPGLLIIGLAMLAASWSFKFLSTAVHVPGKVVDMKQTDSGLWFPVIEFTTRDGKLMNVEGKSASNPSPYTKGQALEILYSPDDPQSWEIKGSWGIWIAPVVIGVVGLIVTIAIVGINMSVNGEGSSSSPPLLGDKMLLLLGVAVFGISGLLMLWGAWHFTKDTREFLPNAISSTGTIIKLKENVSRDSKGRESVSHFPTIEFDTKDNQKVVFNSNLAVEQYKYPVGSSIKILYDRTNPENARIDSFDSLWGATIILAVMGTAFVGGALMVYFILYKQVEVDTALFVAAGFAFAVVLLYAGAWWLGRDSIYFMQHGVRVSGTVVELNPAPLVEFTTKEGKTVKYQSNVSSDPPKYSEGDGVKILYDPNEPSRASIDSFDEMWLFPSVMAGMGTIFLLACIYAIYLRIRDGA